MISSSRPPCSPFGLPVTRFLSHRHRRFNMVADNAFIVSSATAVSISEHLIHALNNVVVNLPLPELRRVCGDLRRTVRLAEDILYNEDVPPGFDTLSINDGTCE
jgi:hypothetical protein